MNSSLSIVVHEGSDDLGLQGIFVTDNNRTISPPLLLNGHYISSKKFLRYDTLSTDALSVLFEKAGYSGEGGDSGRHLNRQTVLCKLMTESLKTGNAGGRMACANIVAVSADYV